MSGQGYHLSLDEDQVGRLLACDNESEAIDCASDFLEGFWAEEDWGRIEGGYKDWNALLLCLTEGTYNPGGGTYLLNMCFFGGRLLARKGSTVNLVMPEEVRDVGEVLGKIDKRRFRNLYFSLEPNKYFEREESWARGEEHMYELFVKLVHLRRFYQRVAQEGRAVLFYSDDAPDLFFEPIANGETETDDKYPP